MARWDDTATRSRAASGRLLAIAAIGWGTCYLIWRLGWSWRSGHHSVASWLWLPLVIVEVLGFAATALLVAALWPRPRVRTPGPTDLEHDVAIIADGRAAEDVRATLVALESSRADARWRGRTLVVEHAFRDEISTIVEEFGAADLAAGADDPSALTAISTACRAPFVLLLDAGDVPVASIVARLGGFVTDPEIVAVQGMVASTPGDSLEHGPNGRHDLCFERVALDPALGAAGSGVLSGSGALIRTSALAETDLSGDNRYEVLWNISTTAAQRGQHVIAAPAPAVVAAKPLGSSAAVAADRRDRASAAWALLVGPQGALRARSVPVRHRVTMASWAVRPLDGARRVALALVVLTALFSGRLPIAPSVPALLGLWLPTFVLANAALLELSGGALRPGDRMRLRSTRLAVALVVGINAVLAVRGVLDRFSHVLPALDTVSHIGLVLLALWVLAGCLDSLRLLARRRHGRRAVRLSSATAGELGSSPAHVADLTMLGAGLVLDHEPTVGERTSLRFTVPSDSGVTSLDLSAVVRNVRAGVPGTWRAGVEFDHSDDYAANALAEACVVLPAWEHLRTGAADVPPGSAPDYDDDLVGAGGPRRTGLRIATLVALAGAVSSAAPLSAQAGATMARTVSGDVVVATDGPPAAPDLTDPATTTIDPATAGSNDIVAVDDGPVASASTDTSSTSASAATDQTAPDSSLPGSVAASDAVVTNPTSPEVSPASGGVGGLTVVGACSTDPGPDGTYGTGDDVYGPSVSTVTDADGHYSLQLDGDACWLSIEPPTGDGTGESPYVSVADDLGFPSVIDLGGHGDVVMPTVNVTSRPIPATPDRIANASIGDHVWQDSNADGTQQADEHGVAGATVTLYDMEGGTVGTRRTGRNGEFAFGGLTAGWYSLGVSNLPDGLRAPHADPVTSRTPLIAVAAGQHVASADVGVVPSQTAGASSVGSASKPATVSLAQPLPRPSLGEVNQPVRTSPDLLPTIVVIFAASLLAGSVLVASAWPIRSRRRSTSR